MMTLKEIARLANMSTTTVSRVLTQDPSFHVPPETRSRIEQIAQEAGYRPRKIHSQVSKNNTVGIVKGFAADITLSSTHVLSLYQSIETTLITAGYNKVVFSLNDMPDQPLDAIIALGQFSKRQIKLMENLTTNILFLYSSPNPLRYDSLHLDFRGVSVSALSYLYSLGHRSIGYIGAAGIIGGMRMEDPLLRSISCTLKDYECYNENWMYVSDYSPAQAYEVTYRWCSNPDTRPTAILYASDTMAIGGYRAIKNLDLELGKDVSVIGIGNETTSSFATPPLTTMQIPIANIAETTVSLIEQRLLKKRTHAIQTIIPLPFIIRSSCGHVSTAMPTI